MECGEDLVGLIIPYYGGLTPDTVGFKSIELTEIAGQPRQRLALITSNRFSLLADYFQQNARFKSEANDVLIQVLCVLCEDADFCVFLHQQHRGMITIIRDSKSDEAVQTFNLICMNISLLKNQPMGFVHHFIFKNARYPAAENGEMLVLIKSVPQRMSGQVAVGYVMWPAAVILSRWLIVRKHLICDKSVLELGAGLGLCGIAMGKFARSVTLTDYNEVVVQHLKLNIALNIGSPLIDGHPPCIANACSIQASMLDWSRLTTKPFQFTYRKCQSYGVADVKRDGFKSEVRDESEMMTEGEAGAGRGVGRRDDHERATTVTVQVLSSHHISTSTATDWVGAMVPLLGAGESEVSLMKEKEQAAVLSEQRESTIHFDHQTEASACDDDCDGGRSPGHSTADSGSAPGGAPQPRTTHLSPSSPSHALTASDDSWDSSGRQFDAIIGSDILCCEADAVGVARAVVTCLAPEGVCYFLVPQPQHRYGTEALVPALRAAGLQVACRAIAHSHYKRRYRHRVIADEDKAANRWAAGAAFDRHFLDLCFEVNVEDEEVLQKTEAKSLGSGFSDHDHNGRVDHDDDGDSDDVLLQDIEERSFQAWQLVIARWIPNSV